MLENLYRRIHSGLNRRLGHFHGGRWAHHVRPSSMALLLTKHCNARCVHCDLWQGSDLESCLDFEQWRSLLDDLRRWLGPVHIALTGGEALLKPFTTELLAYGVSKGFFMELLTNGYRNDPELLKRVALANPGRITLSVDGIGDAHNLIRGRRDFWERTAATIDILCDLRQERKLGYEVLLKCVIMRQNLDHVTEVAHYAGKQGVGVLYQPVEQNYGTGDDPRWFDSAPTWPTDSEEAARTVKELITLKNSGFPILNTQAQLEVMIPYFRNPEASQETVRAHTSHEERPLCAAISMLQVEPNGDITICSRRPPVSNILEQPVQHIWKNRPRWWQGEGCGIKTFCPCDPRQK